MTRILIATPLYPPDIGGPSTYAKGLEESLAKLGVTPVILSYGGVMHYPSGIRQCVYAVRLFRAAFGCDAILALDTLSIGLPAALIGRLVGVAVLVRVAGDRVWEHYVARANDPVPFPDFYTKKIRFSFSERVSAWLTGWTFFFARRVVFSTRWQMDVRMSVYPITKGKSLLVENAYALLPHIEDHCGAVKTFLWAGRDIPLKNLSLIHI